MLNQANEKDHDNTVPLQQQEFETLQEIAAIRKGHIERDVPIARQFEGDTRQSSILSTTGEARTTFEETLFKEAQKHDSLEAFIATATANLLFHGTSENILGELQGGEHDGILWTAKHPDIAQNYIPESGMSTYYSFQADRHQQEKDILPDGGFARAALRLLDFDQKKITIEKIDHAGRISQWSVDRGTEIPTYGKLDRKLRDIGYEDGDNIKMTFIDSKEVILPASHKTPGELYILREQGDLKWVDLRGHDFNGEEAYNQLALFESLREKGYDGVIINDIAQSKAHGNVSHESYGLFPVAIPKVESTKVPAVNFDWESSAEIGQSETPEFITYKNHLIDVYNEAHDLNNEQETVTEHRWKRNEQVDIER